MARTRTGRPLAPLILTEEERATLERFVRRRTVSKQLAYRAEIVLECAKGQLNLAVAKKLRTTGQTVGKWRRRFVEQRLDGLLDEPRPGHQRTVADEQVEEVIVKTLQTKPKAATHWSTRSMAEAVGLSKSTIQRVWTTFGLKPHRSETFTLSPDPLLLEKVHDIVGLYLNPPDQAAVFCVDEKPQAQALNRTQPVLPMTPAQVERGTATYERHGTTSLFAALNVLTGQVLARCHQQHRTLEFVKFLKLIDSEVPSELDVHLVLDNLSTHKAPQVQRWLVRHPRFHVHFTPTYSSWLNLVERWFSLLETKQLKRGVHRSVRELKAALMEFVDATNEAPKPFVWVKTADEILRKIAKVCSITMAGAGSAND